MLDDAAVTHDGAVVSLDGANSGAVQRKEQEGGRGRQVSSRSLTTNVALSRWLFDCNMRAFMSVGVARNSRHLMQPSALRHLQQGFVAFS